MIRVLKNSGQMETFDVKKVERSLRNSGADDRLVNSILSQINLEIYDGISTRKLYDRIYGLLRKEEQSVGDRYNLKSAIAELGPTGYPFEKFISRLLAHSGYQTQTNVIAPGKCVTHEIDVVAVKGKERLMVECKFHARSEGRSDVKVALYIKARFDDLVLGANRSVQNLKFHKAWLVTNTKLTFDAITYGECVGLKMLAWSYPKNGSLQNLIEAANLYPVTSLSLLSADQKQKLLSLDIVLCRDILNKKDEVVQLLNLSRPSANLLFKQVATLCL
ncbi:restriction endonuclease [Candidatus Collierbacteria bacterium]|nr:restriction endonuclease [Candidatus Collierbacteria bacterium]